MYVYKKIRELKSPPPIIMVSVDVDPGVLAEFAKTAKHVAKYSNPNKLGEKVREVVSKANRYPK